MLKASNPKACSELGPEGHMSLNSVRDTGGEVEWLQACLFLRVLNQTSFLSVMEEWKLDVHGNLLTYTCML